MPERSKKPRDLNALAKAIVDEAGGAKYWSCQADTYGCRMWFVNLLVRETDFLT